PSRHPGPPLRGSRRAVPGRDARLAARAPADGRSLGEALVRVRGGIHRLPTPRGTSRPRATPGPRPAPRLRGAVPAASRGKIVDTRYSVFGVRTDRTDRTHRT